MCNTLQHNSRIFVRCSASQSGVIQSDALPYGDIIYALELDQTANGNFLVRHDLDIIQNKHMYNKQKAFTIDFVNELGELVQFANQHPIKLTLSFFHYETALFMKAAQDLAIL